MGYFHCLIDLNARAHSLLELLQKNGFVTIDHFYERDGSIHLDLTTEEIAKIELLGLKVVRVEDLDKVAQQRRNERQVKATDDDVDDDLTLGFVDHYMDAAEIFQAFQNLAAEFPSLCRWESLPESTAGYDGGVVALQGSSEVHYLRITNTPLLANKPGFLLICGTHAREWVNPLVALEFASQLLRNYDPATVIPEVTEINRIIEEVDTLIVPVMNPDGLNYSFHDSAGWRKNRRSNPANPACPGVDNNRNYAVFFGESGSSSSPCNGNYHGSEGFSEVENRNIRFLCEKHPNILIGVDSHSQGEKIFRPTISGGTYTGSLPVYADDEAIYQDLEATAISAIQAYNGKTYLTGTTSNHAGTSDEYLFFAHRVFGFDFECALAHQPALVDGLEAVQEVTSALRALATEAADLQVEPVNPIHLVQCIDRTGSMVTYGYESGARLNAKRLVDLMSLGDWTGVVSFADPSSDPTLSPLELKSQVEHPLTHLDDAGDFASVQSSIDAMIFGGWTSIGAGLLKAAELLAGVATRRGIVLVSDGYENRTPYAAEVLPLLPEGVPVYTIALGSIADTDLLAEIATTTGGNFYLSPTSIDLHQIYNQIRADTSDDDVILNIRAEGSDDDTQAYYEAPVDPGASRITFSLSWESNISGNLQIFMPDGRAVSTGDWGVTRKARAGYVMISILRPVTGVWRIVPSGMSSTYIIAAFVRSACHFEINRLAATAFEAVQSARIRIGQQYVRRFAGHVELLSREISDKNIARYQAISQWSDSIGILLWQTRKETVSKVASRKILPVQEAFLKRDIRVLLKKPRKAFQTLNFNLAVDLTGNTRIQRQVIVTIPPIKKDVSKSGSILGRLRPLELVQKKLYQVEAYAKLGDMSDRLGSSLTDEYGNFEVRYFMPKKIQQLHFNNCLYYLRVLDDEEHEIFSTEHESRPLVGARMRVVLDIDMVANPQSLHQFQC